MYITDYFRQIDQVVSGCPAIISKELYFDGRTKYIGMVKGTLTFGDGSELHFKEFIDTETGITKYKYGYHYQKSDSLIFRYDNHPYPAKKGIPSCHKHVSNEENIIPAPIPDLEDVLKEVIQTSLFDLKNGSVFWTQFSSYQFYGAKLRNCELRD